MRSGFLNTPTVHRPARAAPNVPSHLLKVQLRRFHDGRPRFVKHERHNLSKPTYGIPSRGCSVKSSAPDHMHARWHGQSPPCWAPDRPVSVTRASIPCSPANSADAVAPLCGSYIPVPCAAFRRLRNRGHPMHGQMAEDSSGLRHLESEFKWPLSLSTILTALAMVWYDCDR